MKRSRFLISTSAAGVAAALVMEPTALFAKTAQLKVEDVPTNLSLARQVLLMDKLPADYKSWLRYEKFGPCFVSTAGAQRCDMLIEGSDFILPTFSYASAGQSFRIFKQAADFESKLLIGHLDMATYFHGKNWQISPTKLMSIRRSPIPIPSADKTSVITRFVATYEREDFYAEYLLLNTKTFNKYQMTKSRYYDQKHFLLSEVIADDVMYLTTSPSFLGVMPIRPSNASILPNEIGMAITNQKGVVKVTIQA